MLAMWQRRILIALTLFFLFPSELFSLTQVLHGCKPEFGFVCRVWQNSNISDFNKSPLASSFSAGQQTGGVQSGPLNRSISFFYMAYFSKPQSAAVKITKPTNDDEPVKQPQPRKGQERIALVFVGPPSNLANFPCALDSVQRQCRNIVIYGLVHVLFIRENGIKGLIVGSKEL